jgi:hypothetical protein
MRVSNSHDSMTKAVFWDATVYSGGIMYKTTQRQLAEDANHVEVLEVPSW